jgi:hypothetical protein
MALGHEILDNLARGCHHLLVGMKHGFLSLTSFGPVVAHFLPVMELAKIWHSQRLAAKLLESLVWSCWVTALTLPTLDATLLWDLLAGVGFGKGENSEQPGLCRD